MNKGFCCFGSRKGKFPTFAVLILALGILWLLTDLGYIVTKVSWWPVILIVIALGWIIDNYTQNK